MNEGNCEEEDGEAADGHHFSLYLWVFWWRISKVEGAGERKGDDRHVRWGFMVISCYGGMCLLVWMILRDFGSHNLGGFAAWSCLIGGRAGFRIWDGCTADALAKNSGFVRLK